MYKEKRISIKSFTKTTCNILTGTKCAFDEKHFIDFREECYYNPNLKIYICKKCKGPDEKKFHNIPQNYNGHTYQSTFEAEFAKMLDLKVKAKLIKSWEKQVKLEINIVFENDKPFLTSEPIGKLLQQNKNAYHICNYFMDFVVTNNDDSKTFYETKGAETEVWKLKWRLTEMIFKDKVQLEVIKKKSYKPKKKIK